jgi:hypothetical protein
VRQDSLIRQLGTNEADGTRYWEIVRVAKEYGLEPTIVSGFTIAGLIAEINKRVPVLIVVQAWIEKGDPRDIASWLARKDDGHYLVAIGYDEFCLEGVSIHQQHPFMSPSTEVRSISAAPDGLETGANSGHLRRAASSLCLAPRIGFENGTYRDQTQSIGRPRREGDRRESAGTARHSTRADVVSG